MAGKRGGTTAREAWVPHRSPCSSVCQLSVPCFRGGRRSSRERGNMGNVSPQLRTGLRWAPGWAVGGESGPVRPVALGGRAGEASRNRQKGRCSCPSAQCTIMAALNGLLGVLVSL